ncbi:MAG: 1,4-dihydroxy-6-naphthoate synthase [Desulfobacterales bacterium]|nr:1,4-dihydroxy-6-naphthoate synthase [Desulfobacterales bacterium]
MNRPLTLGYSTCPNDTFIFYALAHQKVNLNELTYQITLADVESLNQRAAAGQLDITKLSFAAIGHLQESYGLLHCGAALGRGCGPLIVAKPGVELAQLGDTPVAVPGAWTTACLLLNLFSPHPVRTKAMTFDQIMPAIRAGEVEAGVIIHEGRFTYREYGLTCLLDLGQWWETQSGFPIPLGGIAVHRSLPEAVILKVQNTLKASIDYAKATPENAADYITRHAQEMAPQVISQHISLYVNEFTQDLGAEGRLAIKTLFQKAAEKGLMPFPTLPLFAC